MSDQPLSSDVRDLLINLAVLIASGRFADMPIARSDYWIARINTVLREDDERKANEA